MTQSIGLFPIHVPILVFARLKNSFLPISNIFPGKILFYSQRFILGGPQSLCLFKDCRGEKFGASSTCFILEKYALGWIHPRIAGVGFQQLYPRVFLSFWLRLWNVSFFSHGGLCLLWNEVNQKEDGRLRSRAPEIKREKAQCQHGPPAIALEMDRSKLSTAILSGKGSNL